MFRTRHKRPDKEPERFYLLPGMGGRAYRRKRQVHLNYSLAVGVLISVLIAVMLYVLDRLRP